MNFSGNKRFGIEVNFDTRVYTLPRNKTQEVQLKSVVHALMRVAPAFKDKWEKRVCVRQEETTEGSNICFAAAGLNA